MFHVIFTYDKESQKWEPVVVGAEDATESAQGFSAVVLTCQELNPNLLILAKAEPCLESDDDAYAFLADFQDELLHHADNFKITPAV